MNRNKCKCLTPELAIASCTQSKTSSRSVMKFYNSIPDYEELHHLNESEFYSKLETLRDSYSKMKYGSDTTLSSDASKSSDDSVQTVKERRITTKRTSSISKEIDKENLGSNDLFNNISKGHDIVMFRSLGRRTKSVSPTRRNSLKSGKKTPSAPKCKSLNRNDSPINEFIPKTKGKKKRAGYIPLTSRVPIYDQIMEDQKHRSEIRKLESAIELQSKIKPFHFSTRSRSRCSSMSAISGDLHSKNLHPSKVIASKRKSSSSYFNGKKWEEDYFRRINRMIRAEELLKLSTPSPIEKKDTPRTKSSGSCKFCVRKKSKRKTQLKQKDQSKVKVVVDDKGSTVDPKTDSPENANTDMISPPLPIYPVARPNLAAKLRAEVARKRTQQISERRQPKSSSQSDWGVRKTPAWKSLAYNETNDEDISYRLATRRAELILRQREHALDMELMRERVRAAPLLLEGTTYWSNRVGKASHDCGKDNHISVGAEKLEKKRVTSANSSRLDIKFIKKMSRSANYSMLQKNNDSDLESEDRAYL